MSVESAPLSLLVATLRYPPYVAGGYEMQTRDVVEGLRARGHRVRVLCGAGSRYGATPELLPWLAPELDGDEDLFERSYRAGNAERFRLHFLRLANYRATLRALRTSAADCLLYFNLALVSLAPILAARHAGVPTLGYAGDAWPLNHWVEDWRASAAADGKPARLVLLERAWRGFRATIGMGRLLACSQSIARRLIDDGIPSESVSVLYPSLPPDFRVGPAPRPRGPGEPLRVLCASSLWKGKGQDVLLAAAARARALGAPLEVVIAGGGRDDWRAELERRRAALGLADGARFTGLLPRAELVREFERAHVLAVPSTWAEPFGLVTLEGMAAGLAVVVSDAGASPELVRDGVEGRVVPAGDAQALAAALVELAGDDRRRLELAARGHATVASRFGREGFLGEMERELFGLVPRERP